MQYVEDLALGQINEHYHAMRVDCDDQTQSAFDGHLSHIFHNGSAVVAVRCWPSANTLASGTSWASLTSSPNRRHDKNPRAFLSGIVEMEFNDLNVTR